MGEESIELSIGWKSHLNDFYWIPYAKNQGHMQTNRSAYAFASFLDLAQR